jgi:hypothetical protein
MSPVLSVIKIAIISRVIISKVIISKVIISVAILTREIMQDKSLAGLYCITGLFDFQGTHSNIIWSYL